MEIGLGTKLYRALYGDRDEEVIELCNRVPEGPLHVFTIHNDTVLHSATYMEKFELAFELLDNLPSNLYTKLTHENDWGNTILHNASTTNNGKGISFARNLLHKAPKLLLARNRWGESAVFQATRYGRRKSFEFLCEEVDKYCEIHTDFDSHHFFQRDDKTTILHMSILVGKLDMALMIARRYQFLCTVQAQDQMTAAQILACDPTAFRSGTKLGFLKELIYTYISTGEHGRHEAGQTNRKIRKAFSLIFDAGKFHCILPVIEAIREMKRNHENVLKLAKILVQNDTSWKKTYKPGVEVKPVIIASAVSGEKSGGEDRRSKQPQESGKDESLGQELVEIGKHVVGGVGSVDSFFEQDDYDTQSCKTSYRSVSNTNETPLLLAARKGCLEIVEEILDMYPQAVEYLNHDGQTLLHVAARNRQLNVIEMVMQKKLHFRGLIGVVDKRGNSVLHMVGSRKEVLVDAKMKSPVLQLSEDLLLLEYMKAICPDSQVNHHNDQMMTADELFARNNEKLRNEAKEWLKRTAEHCTVVIVLIATVAFAAAYTIPGGPNQATGVPLLLGQPFFLVLTVTDVLSLAFALTAVVIFLALLTSSFQLKDFRRSLPQKLLLGFTLLFLSVSMMMVSFAATIILMIHNRERWTKIAIYAVAFFPVSIFVFSYIPLYIQLADTFKYWVKKISKALPRCECAPRLPACLPFIRSSKNSASSRMPSSADDSV